MGEDRFQLTGKRVLVTGGTRGIGRAITLRFARAGASVLANFLRDEASAEALVQIAGNESLAVLVCRADLTGEHGLEKLQRSLEEFGPTLDCLVHCAATGIHRPLNELTVKHFDWTMALNVRAFFEVVRRVSPRLREGGAILAISSEGAARAVPMYTLVGASKGALEAMVRHMAVEFAPRGIRVNTLAPGAVQTRAWEFLPNARQRLDDIQRRTPAGRLADLDEVAFAAQFLCSDAASGILGQTLIVDRGLRIVG